MEQHIEEEGKAACICCTICYVERRDPRQERLELTEFSVIILYYLIVLYTPNRNTVQDQQW